MPRLRDRLPFMSQLAAFALLLALGAADPSLAYQGEPSREERIAAIERQIKTLQQQLEALRRENGGMRVNAVVEGTLPEEWVKTLRWRQLGPAAMGGRITDIAVFEADPTTYWVATASGGLLKTTNNGTTFEHQFDREATVSIGDVAVAPSDRNVVWVGTGENNPRNSVSYGDGVHKSTDGGKTWTNIGLRKSFQIGRIVIHPKDPNVVYVGALGRLYGPNEERGLFKTTDGGKTWTKALFVDEKTGVIDLVMHPTDPETLVAATWERQRDEFDSHRGEPALQDGYDAYDPLKKWGPGSGLWKSSDGGKNWKRLTQGLPASPMGRIGIDWYRKDPSVLYAVLDCQKIGMGTPPSRVWMGVQGQDGDGGARLTQITPNSPAAKAGLKAGDVVKAVDKQPVTGYQQLTARLRGRKADEKLVLEIVREGQSQEVTVTLEERPLSAALGGGRGGGGGGFGRSPLGALLGAITEDAEGGPRITRLFPERVGEKAGLREGDVLKELDGKPVGDAEALGAALGARKDGDKVTIKLQRGEEAKEVAVTLEDPATTNRTRPWGFQYGGQQPNVQEDQGPGSHEYGGVYRSADGGESWTRINSLNPRPMYFSQIRVDPSDEQYLYVLGIDLHRSKDGGKTFTDDGGNEVHPDHHALWIDPRDGRHMVVGGDGGFYVTYDRMERWDHLNHLALGQFYHVAVDSRTPYRVFGGLQDNGSWGGPSMGLSGSGAVNEEWFGVSGGDGFTCRVDPDDPDLVYFTSQDGNIGRRHLRTGARGSIRPRNPSDPSGPPSPRGGGGRGVGSRYRFNWSTPFILSSHNGKILYSAGNYVFRSVKSGDELKVISPEIARTGRGTGTALSESPLNPDVLWAGTDDGNLWITRDGGANWANVAEKVGLPGPRWVATVEASRFVEGRAYVAFDAHRSDDDEPYLYVTEDFGHTWKSLRANLPAGSTRCLREDLKNRDLLYCGTEFGAWVSLNRGYSWTKLNNNLPTVAVHEFAQHPTAGEMVAATHGRSLWALDVTPLRQMTTATLTADAHLYEPAPAVRWRTEPAKGSPYGSGHRRFFGDNPPRGATLTYSLAKKAEKATLKVLDHTGATVRELAVKAEPGLHQVTWDLSRTPAGRRSAFGVRRSGQVGPNTEGRTPNTEGQPEEPPLEGMSTRPQGQGGPGGRGGFRGQQVAPGLYRVVLTVDGKEFAHTLRVEPDPVLGNIATSENEVEAEERPRPQPPADR